MFQACCQLELMLCSLKYQKKPRKKEKSDFFFLFSGGRVCCVIYGFNTASRLPVFISTRHQSYARPYRKFGAHFNQTQSFSWNNFR